MTHHTITGGGGVRLHAVETGNAGGRPILFIHGISQCWLSWSRQLRSDLADRYRLVAMDLRGHGLSEDPADGDVGSERLAEDVAAVIGALHLDRPVLCGWSYGPLVILDYVRHHGADAIGGIVFAGGITKLGSQEAAAVLSPEFLALVPGLLSTEAEQGIRSLRALLHLCVRDEPAAEDLFLMLGYNAAVRPAVRQALLSRSIDNDDILPTITTPVLIVHGERDRIVRTSAVEQHKARLPHAEVAIMANAPHTPFWDDAAAFNARLDAFCARLEVQAV